MLPLEEPPSSRRSTQNLDGSIELDLPALGADSNPFQQEFFPASSGGTSFVEGEYTRFLGSPKLITRTNRWGVRLGWQIFEQVHYLSVQPEVDFRTGKWRFAFGIPVAFEMFNGHMADFMDDGFRNVGKIRTSDWDELGEYFRFVRHLEYGQKKDGISFRLSQAGSLSLGHGQLLRRYSINLDPYSTSVALQLNMHNEYSGLEFMVDNLVGWNLFGARVSLNPLIHLARSPIAKSLSFSYTYMLDRKAPVVLQTITKETAINDNPYYIEGKPKPDLKSQALLHGMSLDLEIGLRRTPRYHLIGFFDVSWMLPAMSTDHDGLDSPEAGVGLTCGLQTHISIPSRPAQAFRLVGELRIFSPTYLPSYFNLAYDVQKYLIDLNYRRAASLTGALPPTKFQDVFINRKDQSWQMGFYLEMNYALVDYFSITIGMEGSDAKQGNSLLAHLEVPIFDWFQVFGSYYQHSMDSLLEMFSNRGDDKIIFFAGRVRVWAVLYVNFGFHQTLQMVEGQSDIDGGNTLENVRLLRPRFGWLGDIEVGWQF